MSAEKSPELARSAHGAAAEGGALLVVECPPLDEVPPVNAGDTGAALALASRRGRPFTRGNTAATNKGTTLTRTGVDLDAADEVRRGVQRRAESLRRARVREERVRHGGALSAAVQAEIASWALALAWSRHSYDQGDAARGAKLSETASGHLLKSIAIAEREGAARPAADDDVPPGFERVPDGEE